MIMQVSGEAVVDDWGREAADERKEEEEEKEPARASSGVESFYWGKRIPSTGLLEQAPPGGRCPVTGARAGDAENDGRRSPRPHGLQAGAAQDGYRSSGGQSQYGTQTSKRSSWRDTDRKLLKLKLGVLELEDGYLLSHYRIENNSVVHAEWDSLQRAPPYASTLLSWLDPDYWCENQKQAKHFLKNLSYEQMVQQNWWGKLVWPGPLVMSKRQSVMA